MSEPWSVSGSDGEWYIDGPDWAKIPDTLAFANYDEAIELVRRWNDHDRLIAELREARAKNDEFGKLYAQTAQQLAEARAHIDALGTREQELVHELAEARPTYSKPVAGERDA